MKARLFLFLSLWLILGGKTIAQNSKFHITSRLSGAGDLRRVAGAVTYFITQFDNRLKERYPCAKVQSDGDIAVILGHERQRALFGTNNERSLSEIAGAMGCDFLINLEVGILPGEKFMVAASLIPYRNKWNTKHFIAYSPLSENSGNQNFNNCDEVAQKVVDCLKNVEVCPFKGPINVTVKTELSNEKHESYPVYCNGKDGLYKMDFTDNKTSDAMWKLNKTRVNQIGGSITYNLLEDTETIIQNDCYPCQSGRQGARLSTEKMHKTAKIEGLSKESVAENQYIEDARAEITFLDDGTYTLQVKATSKRGDLSIRSEKHAEGTCDNIKTPPEKIAKKADVLLNEIFGPFAGTSEDKVLSQQQTLTRVDPLTKEKTTISFDFNLKRD